MGEAYSLQGGDKGALMQMNCNVCHRYDRDEKADLINLGKKLVNEKGCRACHVVNGRGGTIGPDLTVGDKAAEQYDMSRLGGQKTAFAWHVAHLKNPKEPRPRHRHAELRLRDEGVPCSRPSSSPRAARPSRRRTAPASRGPTRRRPEEIAEEERMKHGPGAWVRLDRLLRLPFGLLPRGQERRAGRARPLDRRRGHAEPLRQDGGRLHKEPDRTMSVVLSRQIVLTDAEKEVAIQKLREAFAEHQKQKAAAAAAR